MNNIDFKFQKKFDGCKGIRRKLPFDFYLTEYNICIEFDGRQHHKPVKFNGMDLKRATEIFEKTKINDNIKNLYCKDNDIKLLRIPYWEKDNIEDILKSNIK